jgi:choline dehydrogenase-like flavoprotein
MFSRRAQNTSYDWLFTTVPQPCANNRSLIWNRGKGIGGSTAVNFMAWGVGNDSMIAPLTIYHSYTYSLQRPASGEIDGLIAILVE